MFKCFCCGYEFDQPTNRYNIAVDEWDEDAGCPACGSASFEEMEEPSFNEDEE